MTDSIIDKMHQVVNSEISALQDVNKEIDTDESDYTQVINLCQQTKDYIVFMGVGKTGHIAKKLAATFSSLGTPSFFVHATESMHGDLGMITKNDTVFIISNSGETKETLAPIRFIKRIGAKTIAMTGNKNSSLAKACDFNILVHVEREADSLNLAPTSSSTAELVIGDAIGCTLSELKGFTEKDFAGFHPGGALGKKLFG